MIAKWISAHGITPAVLTLHADTSGGDAGGKPAGESSSEESVKPDEEVVENPIVCKNLSKHKIFLACFVITCIVM